MAQLRILDAKLIDIIISRMSQELIENYGDFSQTVLIGMQPRGVFFAKRIQTRLQEMTNSKIPLGILDVTFYRDDFRRREKPLEASKTDIPFLIENKRVVIIDDVLYSGRTVNAAMSALGDFGRPLQVELMVLVDRKYTRHLPIEANYVGKTVNSIQSQKVNVEWTEQGFAEDSIWLINQE